MTTKDLIGHNIDDILGWFREENGLDEAQIFLRLDNGKVVVIPHFLEQEIEIKPEKEVKSVFLPKKTIQKSLWGYYKKICYQKPPQEIDETIKRFKNQKIMDFLSFEDNPDYVFEAGLLELSNGFLITETTVSPSGTGQAGLNFFESVEVFENLWKEKPYKRLSEYFL